MDKNLPVPPELEHLIEKRDRETDRRKPQNQSASPTGAAPDDKPAQRPPVDRRRKQRRKSDR
jgi:hypothetical protein